jgi:hypothetical protein
VQGGTSEIQREMGEATVVGQVVGGLWRAVEEVRSALNEHVDVVAKFYDLVSAELSSEFAPASTPSSDSSCPWPAYPSKCPTRWLCLIAPGPCAAAPLTDATSTPDAPR